MRTFFSAFLALVAMVATVIAVPSMWVTERLVHTDGFTSVISPLADDPEMQEYIAAKITDQVVAEVSVPGAAALVAPVAKKYTQSSDFRTDFSDVVRQQHDWLFAEAPADGSDQSMRLNITPMINRAIRNAHLPFSVNVSQQVEVPIAEGGGLEAGRYHHVGQQITTIGYVSTAVAVIAALLALIVARRRGTTLAWLGIGALLAAAALWLLSLSATRIVDEQFGTNDSTDQIVTRLAVDAVASDLVHWAIISAIAGAAVTVLGIVFGVLFRSPARV